jgi:hypothetical protein
MNTARGMPRAVFIPGTPIAQPKVPFRSESSDMNATHPPVNNDDAAEKLTRAHDRGTTASTESNDEGGLAEGGGLGGEAGVTSAGDAVDGGPAADPGHVHKAKATDAGRS